jgi:phosphoribosylaminoimidazole-succinocarboxamide synthase
MEVYTVNNNILAEGKTKLIQKGSQPHTIEIMAKDFLTGGDAARKEEITDIGIQKTKQASNVFKMLEFNNISTSFIELISPNTMLCDECKMLPLEFVVRRYAWGSFLLRNNQYKKDIQNPHRFDKPVWEIFHKHSAVMPPHVNEPMQMEENEARDKFLKDGEWALGVYTDPYIKIGDQWELYSAKDSISGKSLMSTPNLLNEEELNKAINNIVIPSFEALENNWMKISTVDGPVHLVDIKFELGFRTKDKVLVLSDVVDNDSWRIWPGGKPDKQLDKQSFREGENLSNVSNKYQLVTELTNQFKGV